MALSLRRLKKLLDYDSETGRFTWRIIRGRAGRIAGTIKKKDGRRQICIDRVIYMAGPLAVFWMTGVFPTKQTNCSNGRPDDLRWSNLRLGDHSQCGATARPRPNKKRDAPKGVSWDKAKSRYAARIKVNYKMINLGRFERAADAQAAYLAAARKYFGAFARG